MSARAAVAAIAAVLTVAPALRAAEVELRTFPLDGRTRAYFRFAPDGTCGPGPSRAPLVILHHGTGGDGSELVEAWRPVARRERVILVAPVGTGRHGWQAPADGPVLHRELVREVSRECAVDPRRVYLVGFSNGGDHALYLALAQSEFFAGAAILCAALRPRQLPMVDLPPRQVPIFYVTAERDAIYPPTETRATSAALRRRGWPLRHREMRGEAHGYPAGFASEAWLFLRDQALAGEPRFVELDERWLSYALR